MALCDEELCQPTASAIKPLFVVLQEDALPTFSTLLSSMREIYARSGFGGFFQGFTATALRDAPSAG